MLCMIWALAQIEDSELCEESVEVSIASSVSVPNNAIVNGLKSELPNYMA